MFLRSPTVYVSNELIDSLYLHILIIPGFMDAKILAVELYEDVHPTKFQPGLRVIARVPSILAPVIVRDVSREQLMRYPLLGVNCMFLSFPLRPTMYRLYFCETSS